MIMMGLNNLAVDIPWVDSSCPLFPGWIEIQNVSFYQGRKPVGPGEKPRGARKRTNEKLNLRVTLGPWIEHRPRWCKASALNTAPPPAPSPLPNIKYYSHKHITERKWMWWEWNFETNFDENWKLLFGRNFLPKDYVEVGSKKNNAKAWKSKKRKNKLKWNKYMKHYFVLLPKVTWLRQSPRACFRSTLKEKNKWKARKNWNLFEFCSL